MTLTISDENNPLSRKNTHPGNNVSPGEKYHDSYTRSEIDEDEGASSSVTAVSLLAFIGWLTYTIGVGLMVERARREFSNEQSSKSPALKSNYNSDSAFYGGGFIKIEYTKPMYFNPIELIYHAVYYALVNFAFALIAPNPSLASNRFAVIVFLGVGLSFLTSDIVSIIPPIISLTELTTALSAKLNGRGSSEWEAYYQKAAAALSELNATLAGSILLIMAWSGMIFNLSRSASNKQKL
jgi:hypothetical protein